jgi:hypothetical protein
VAYAAKIAQWQKIAVFASSVAWAGPMKIRLPCLENSRGMIRLS